MNENKSEKISVRIPLGLKKYLEDLAEENGMTISELVRNALIWFQAGLIANKIELPKVNNKRR